MKNLLKLSALFSAVLMLQFCTPATTEEEVENTDSTVVQEEVQEPTRESLILNREVMLIADAENPTDFELKHTPEISVGEEVAEDGTSTVDILLGSNGIIHPAIREHWIDYIALYLDDELIEKREFENGPESGKTTFNVNLEGKSKIKIESGCNIHGIWSSEITVNN